MILTAIHIALYIIWVFYFTFLGFHNIAYMIMLPLHREEGNQGNFGKFLDSLFILLTSYLVWAILL